MSKKTPSEIAAEAFSPANNFGRDSGHGQEVSVSLQGVSVPISIRISARQLAILKGFAEMEGIGYQTLLKRWLDERLRAEALAHLSKAALA